MVSSPSEKPLWLGEERINKEVGGIEPIDPIKNPQKVVKLENKKIAVPETEVNPEPEPQTKTKPEPEPGLVWSLSEPEERIKTGYTGFLAQGAKKLTDGKGGSLPTASRQISRDSKGGRN